MANKPPEGQEVFLTKEDLIARMKGTMFPKGKQFAPSLVMWGDPHGEELGDGADLDALDHLAPPDDAEDEGNR